MIMWLAMLATSLAFAPGTPTGGRDEAAAEHLGWKLSIQAGTFRDRTAFEAIDAARALGVKYMEFYPGQMLSPDQKAGVGPDLSLDQRAALKDKLRDAGI